jgi:putative membrane protein insertion efficiency factor
VNLVQHILILLVRLYRCTLSPAKIFIFGPSAQCRFEPGCSQYALTALKSHGAVSGSWLAVKRVCRCHPWGDCGHDPVPPKEVRSGKPEAPAGQISAPVLTAAHSK